MGILLELLGGAVHGTSAVGAAQEYAGQPLPKLMGDFEKRHYLPGAGRTFDSEVVAEVGIKTIQRG